MNASDHQASYWLLFDNSQKQTGVLCVVLTFCTAFHSSVVKDVCVFLSSYPHLHKEEARDGTRRSIAHLVASVKPFWDLFRWPFSVGFPADCLRA